MKLLIRADASPQIGTGHVRRCLALADQAANRGWTVCFAIRNPDANTIQLVHNSGHSVRALLTDTVTGRPTNKTVVKHAHWLSVPQELDAEETAMFADEIRADWVVVDHYALDIEWHRIVRKHCQNIMVIDDLADRDFDCSLLLDQNLGAREKAYGERVHSECKYLFGPNYALLRQEFREWRQISLSQRAWKRPREILVTMGGADTSNFTQGVLRKLEDSEFAKDCRFTAVLGTAYPHRHELENYCASSRLTLAIHFDVNNMAEMMSNAHICIGAAGSTSWERCCLGLPTLTMAIADNQLDIVRALEENGVAWRSSLETIRNDFDELFLNENSAKLKNVVSRAASICDGLGVDRILDQMER